MFIEHIVAIISAFAPELTVAHNVLLSWLRPDFYMLRYDNWR